MNKRTGFEFFLKEWLLFASASGLALTSIHLERLPAYSTADAAILFVLFALFVAVKGLETSGLFLRLAQRVERGARIPLKLTLVTFFLSMFVTNDVALVVVVPLTLALRVEKKGLIVILEALAANAGSALTPFGNPQNLFIYWYYDLSLGEFLYAIGPFSCFFLGLLAAAALSIRVVPSPPPAGPTAPVKRTAPAFAALLLIVILAVLRLLPVWTCGLALVAALLIDRKSFAVDYALLASFFCFFGLAENLTHIFSSSLRHTSHVFMLSSMASQVMSNVPAALLCARFTDHWRALLWGVNVGGFGSLVASLATVIAYRLYLADEQTDDAGAFTVKLLLCGYAAFFMGVGLYAVVRAYLF